MDKVTEWDIECNGTGWLKQGILITGICVYLKYWNGIAKENGRSWNGITKVGI